MAPRRIFIAVSAALLVLLPALSKDYGVSGDEPVMRAHGRVLYRWYASLGRERAAIEEDKAAFLHLYGGVFDLLVTAAGELLPLDDPYRLRHAANAFVGACGIVLTGLLAREVAGWGAGVLAMLLLALSPGYVGQAMNNPKDIPFAAAYAFGLLGVMGTIRAQPRPGGAASALAALGIGAAIGVRIGGAILIAYLLLFAMAATRSERRGLPAWSEAARILARTGGVAAAAYGLGLLFWPYGLVDPLRHPPRALAALADFPVKIRVLFGGEHMWADEIPWFYIPKWIAISTPPVALAGSVLFVLLAAWGRRRWAVQPLALLLLAVVAPLAVVIARRSSLYDGWRHFLFVYPPLTALAATGWSGLLGRPSRPLRLAAGGGFFVLAFPTLLWMARNHPHEAVYFNPLVGGLRGAYGCYETDYYMNSIKGAAEWLLANRELENPGRPVVVATSCDKQVEHYLRHARARGAVTVRYTHYYQRGAADWDYAIFYSRYVHRDQLANGSWPPRGAIHRVEADGVPLAIVVERRDRLDLEGHLALERGDHRRAIALLERARAADPTQETVPVELGLAYLAAGEGKRGVAAARAALDLNPEHPGGLFLLGSAQAAMGEWPGAAAAFGRLARIQPANPRVRVELGRALARAGGRVAPRGGGGRRREPGWRRRR